MQPAQAIYMWDHIGHLSNYFRKIWFHFFLPTSKVENPLRLLTHQKPNQFKLFRSISLLLPASKFLFHSFIFFPSNQNSLSSLNHLFFHLWLLLTPQTSSFGGCRFKLLLFFPLFCFKFFLHLALYWLCVSIHNIMFLPLSLIVVVLTSMTTVAK